MSDREPTTKGMYLACAMDLIAEREGQTKARALATELGIDAEPSEMRSYPLSHLTRLVFTARDRYWPDERDEALAERFGAHAFGTFARSLVGRVGLNLTLNGSPQKVAESVVGMQRASSKDGTCDVASVDDKSFTLRYAGPINPHYTLGMMKVGFELGGGGKVELATIRSCQLDDNFVATADFDLKVTLGNA
jgi:uncharacterized protein (TIGR02265 family)